MDKTQMILDEARHKELLKSSEELLKALKALEKVVSLSPTVDLKDISLSIDKLVEKIKEPVVSPSIPQDFMKDLKSLFNNKNYTVEITDRDFDGNIKNLKITQI